MTTIHRLALKLAFGAAVFGVIAWLVDLTETFQVLRGVNSTWLLLAVLCYISKWTPPKTSALER